MDNCTYIDGVASSQAIDTSGEIVDIRGLDTSSLVGAALNWEHESKLPAQVVGKILEAHKIFSKEDCQNDRHLYYWNKCQIPFLYVMGRLFDDKKASSKEVAALFQDDAEHPSEPDMVGFSVEGSKIPGAIKGIVITRSIARKITITNLPCNKTCIAEIMPEQKVSQKDDISSLFKGEMELFKFEPSYVEIMEKKEKELEKDIGGIASGGMGGMGSSFSSVSMSVGMGSNMGMTRKKKKQLLLSEELEKDAGAGGGGAFIGSQLAMSEKNKKMNKSTEVGSSMAAPSQLTGGAALSKENLDKKSLLKKEKSSWYNRADQAYNTWDKREHFRSYMKQKMPHLAMGEIDAIGRVIALKKTVQAEGKLSKMYASYFNKNEELEKGSDIMMASENYIHGLPKGHPSLGEHKGHTYRRISPPTADSNHWTWAVRSPEGKDSKVNLPGHTAGTKDSIHNHINSLGKK